MTLTLSEIPGELDAELRRRAAAKGMTLESVALDALRTGLGIERVDQRIDLSDVAGTWVHDPAVESALEDQDRVDPEMWR